MAPWSVQNMVPSWVVLSIFNFITVEDDHMDIREQLGTIISTTVGRNPSEEME